MTRTRRIINVVMTIAVFCSLFIVVFAVTNANFSDMKAAYGVNAYEYAKAPDGIYVFQYYGKAPNTDFDIDTSECIDNRLYVYYSATDSLIEILSQTVSGYTCTQSALYYVTADQKIYKTDYTGASHEYLYQCTQGTISMLNSYFDTLYFIEGRTRIICLDVASKDTQGIWEYEYLDWMFVLNDTQLIATTTQEEDYLYDISADTATRISSVTATNMVTAAIKGTASNNTRTADNPTASYDDAVLTQENDVSFPLTEYWANPDGCYETSEPYRSTPSSWFHNNGQEGCNNDTNCTRYCGSSECKGFAKYVHDYYAHMDDNIIITDESLTQDERYARADELWEDRTCMVTHSYMNNANHIDNKTLKLWPSDTKDNIDTIKEFFEGLNTGAYVRYGKYLPVKSESGEILVAGDSTPWNGCHSIVFIANDEYGIWVYECNQEYETYDPNNEYGCGVFIQYYPYKRLFRYKYILNYVNHDYTGERRSAEDGYHTVGCKNCDAYIKHDFNDGEEYSYVNAYYHKYVCQEYVDVNKEQLCGYIEQRRHDSDVLTYVNENQHLERLNCCDERIVAVSHSRVTYSNITFTQHTAHYWCCNNTVTEPHTFGQTPSTVGRCTGCNYEPVPGAELNDSDQQEEA